MAYISKEELLSKINNAITENPDIKTKDIVNLVQNEPDAEITELNIATGILESALSELAEGAEDWYLEELLDTLGTDEEELRSLGIRW